MTGASADTRTGHGPDLDGKTLIVIGGSCGIGLETARLARSRGAAIVLVARDVDPLFDMGLELGAGISAFDPTDFDRLGLFFDALPEPADHVVVTGDRPRFGPRGGFDLRAAHHDVDRRLLLPLYIAQRAASALRPGGSMLLVNGVAAGPGPGDTLAAALRAGLPAVARGLARELAPARVNAITASFTGPARTEPSGPSASAPARIADPGSVAALAVHLMLDTTVTGTTVDIAEGESFVLC